MKVEAYKGDPKDLEIKSALVMVYEGDLRPLSKLGRRISGRAKKALELDGFTGKEGETTKVPLPGLNIPLLYVIGLGKKERVREDTYRRAIATAVKRLKKDRVEESVVLTPKADRVNSQAIAEGAILGSYTFDKYKKREEKRGEVKKLLIAQGDKDAIKKGYVLGECQNYARDLVNEPGNVINPITLAEEAQKLAKEFKLKVKIYDEKEIQDMGMLALWSVGKGSSTPPRFIHMTYKPRGRAKDKIVIVGKGLTFDSGGLNIKPGDYMRTMKMDKSGACAVLGIMRAIAQLKPQVEVHGIIGAAENMPSGTAYRPDDIIRAKNGKHIEIDNTDAEGRVTLADALSYASELKPSAIIDMATLTGACMVALGEFTAGLFSNSDNLAKRLEDISKNTGERLWRLPLDDDRLRKKIKKGPADVVNTGGRYGGAITAAMFLEEFVDEGIEWAHLDIAGPAWSREDYGYYTQGGTGFGVRTLTEFILGK